MKTRQIIQKYILVSIFFMISYALFSQVGIGTTTPQEDLHISGASSTIRIESLNAANNTYNDGVKLAPAYVDGNGDITIGNGSGATGQEPLNFLLVIDNFVTDDPYSLGIRTGVVVNNNDLGETVTEGLITTVTFDTPQDAFVEVKYGMTMIVVGNDLSAGCPCFYPTLNQAVSMFTYFKVDVGNDGFLDPTEDSKYYGQKSQYFATSNQGSIGYPYQNGQGMLKVPAGTHTIYFFGRVEDDASSYTSVGFGGAQDYLKIRIYN
ncbi:hypothetical protein J1N09_12440 [Aureitalea sp. L0-47]|uniref:hypothetical protein n=1 Tax=Aureitalea sp. L0-47 TaxID=2816962 RepID=UPI0022390A6D|nr:hypothetical protein [Aureitalea sp. L0-47]MCW5520654.1 hypothetical protein [Aureitalea sp. L0-47]